MQLQKDENCEWTFCWGYLRGRERQTKQQKQIETFLDSWALLNDFKFKLHSHNISWVILEHTNTFEMIVICSHSFITHRHTGSQTLLLHKNLNVDYINIIGNDMLKYNFKKTKEKTR